jgi:asparagine synthase (glutamine-hydrolysing)
MWKSKGNETFHTYNWCRPGPDDDPEWHEWGDARKIAEIEGFEHSEIDCNAEEIKKMFLTHDIRVDGTTTYEYERILLPQAEDKGIRLILSGFGGDEILTARFKDTHIDKIRKGRFVAAWKALKNELPKSRRYNVLRLPYRYLKLIGKGIIPDRFRQNKASYTAEKIVSMSLEMLQDDFTRYALSHHTNVFSSLCETIAGRQLFYIDIGLHQERLENWTALGRQFGIHYVYPYLDKRIIEFALSIPSTLYFKEEQSHYLYHQIVKLYLPSFMLDKRKPSEIKRVENIANDIYEAIIDDKITNLIYNYNNVTYINHEKYLRYYKETVKNFKNIENTEELLKIDRLKSILLIKKML